MTAWLNDLPITTAADRQEVSCRMVAAGHPAPDWGSHGWLAPAPESVIDAGGATEWWKAYAAIRDAYGAEKRTSAAAVADALSKIPIND